MSANVAVLVSNSRWPVPNHPLRNGRDTGHIKCNTNKNFYERVEPDITYRWSFLSGCTVHVIYPSTVAWPNYPNELNRNKLMTFWHEIQSNHIKSKPTGTGLLGNRVRIFGKLSTPNYSVWLMKEGPRSK